MEQHYGLILSIAGFLIVMLLSVIGFFGQRWFKSFDNQFDDIKSWFNTVVNIIKGLEKRVDDSIMNTKLNEAAIREIQSRLEQRLVGIDNKHAEQSRKLDEHERRLNDIDKKFLKQWLIHNEIHPEHKLNENI